MGEKSKKRGEIRKILANEASRAVVWEGGKGGHPFCFWVYPVCVCAWDIWGRGSSPFTLASESREFTSFHLHVNAW